MRLSNSTAIVTGGAGCLGRAISLGLRAEGCRVVVVDHNVSDFAALASEHDINVVACDLVDPDATERTIGDAWKSFGPISILINAVGMIHSAPLINIASISDRRHRIDAWRRVIDANLTSVFLATVNMVDHMVSTRSPGVVVTLSSIAAAGNAGQGAYSAAKAGVNAATQAWAKELGPIGIRFIAIAAGFIDTASTRVALQEAQVQDWTRRTPLRRLGSVEAVTSAVLFAITNEHLTGKVIEIDGGLTL